MKVRGQEKLNRNMDLIPCAEDEMNYMVSSCMKQLLDGAKVITVPSTHPLIDGDCMG